MAVMFGEMLSEKLADYLDEQQNSYANQSKGVCINMAHNKSAQMTIRHGSAHVQVGSMGSYEKFDIPASDEIKCYYDCQVKKGNFGRSWADTDTKYVPVTVSEETRVVRTVRGIESAPFKATVSE